jgi:hypothetical protein
MSKGVLGGILALTWPPGNERLARAATNLIE